METKLVITVLSIRKYVQSQRRRNSIPVAIPVVGLMQNST